EGHQRDHRRGPDDDPQYRQGRAQLMQPQAAQGQGEAAPALGRGEQGQEQAHEGQDVEDGQGNDHGRSLPGVQGAGGAAMPSAGKTAGTPGLPSVSSLRVSDSTRPSRMRTTRRAQRAMSFSCVTMMMVLPA